MAKPRRRLLSTTPPPAEVTDPGARAGDPVARSVAESRGAGAVASRRMGRWSIGWRIGASVIALGILTAGQFLGTNDFFPLGSLTQYATAKDLNGSVRSTCIAAQFPGEDEPRRLAFNTATVGIERGDIESQLQRVIDHPELLQTLADSYIRLHPDEPRPERMILCRTVTQLRDGLPVGEPEELILASWEVR